MPNTEYQFDRNLNLNRAFIYQPIPELTLSSQPESESGWLDDLAERCQLLTNPNPFQKHYDADIHQDLYCVYLRLKGDLNTTLGLLSENEKNGIILKLREEVTECKPGFHNRVRSLLLTMQRPQNMPQLLYKVRMSLVAKVAATSSSEIHAYNRVFTIAATDGLGVAAVSMSDPHRGNSSTDTIRDTLKEAFFNEYRTFRLPQLICDELRGILPAFGYTGQNITGYRLTEYKNITDYLNLTLQTKKNYSDFFLFDEDSSKFTDINWPFLVSLCFSQIQELLIVHPNPQPLTLTDYAHYSELFSTDAAIKKLKPYIQTMRFDDSKDHYAFAYTSNTNTDFHTKLCMLLKHLTLPPDQAMNLLAAMHLNTLKQHNLLESIVLSIESDINTHSVLGHTALSIAACYGDIQLIERLLAKGAATDAEDNFKRTPLMLAAISGQSDVIPRLQQANMDIDTQDSHGRTPLMAAIVYKQYRTAMKLIDYGANTNSVAMHETPALILAIMAQVDELVNKLLQKGADPDMPNDFNEPPVYIAASLGRVDFVHQILSVSRQSLNTETSVGDTALHIAITNGYPETVIVLLGHGAAINLATQTQATPLITACDTVFPNTQTIDALLTHAEIDLEAKCKDGKTALMHAASRGHTTVVKQLLRAGANSNLVFDAEQNALEYAAENNHTETCLLLASQLGILNYFLTTPWHRDPYKLTEKTEQTLRGCTDFWSTAPSTQQASQKVERLNNIIKCESTRPMKGVPIGWYLIINALFQCEPENHSPLLTMIEEHISTIFLRETREDFDKVFEIMREPIGAQLYSIEPEEPEQTTSRRYSI